MALKQEKNYTIDDIYALPNGERAELINGIIYNMAPPNRIHQKIVHFFDRVIGNFIENNNGDCEVYPSPFAVFLNGDEKTYIEPDISVICDKSKLDNRGCNGAPDWVIEVVSNSSKKMDYFIKLFKYRSAGVREYWIVDPIEKCITVYDFEHDDGEKYMFDDKIKVGIYDKLEVDLSKLLE